MGVMKKVVLAVWLIATVTGYRLPQTTRPTSYDIKLKPYVDTTFVFEGSVVIHIDVVDTTDILILHSSRLDISLLTVNDIELDETKYTLATDDTHFLTINLDEPLAIGSTATVEIHYTGELADDMYGFYKSSYVTQTNEDKWLAATQFQPTHARRVFPCYDEPEFKAKFLIEITTPEGYQALANTPTSDVSPSETDEGWTVYKFEETDLMSSYLVAFVVSDFKQLLHPTAKYSFSAWAREEAIVTAQYSQDIGPDLVDYFEEYTGIDYTFDKIDQVALPDFAAGAMENWGLITYRETMLLHYDEATTEASKKSIAMVVAHELAHMWFGNLITLKWWSETWLNEGFARYFQYLATSNVERDWRLMDQFLVDQQQGIFITDSVASAQALTSACETPAQIMGKFTSISYNKGASILRMLSHILTPEIFNNALKEYLSTHQDKNTIPEDLFLSLETARLAANTEQFSVHDFLPLWTTQPGYPVVTVTRDGNTFTITQERFLFKDDGQSDHEHWWVPLTWTKELDAPGGFNLTQPTDWLNGVESKEIEIEADAAEWVIFNNQETGYYRVNYDTESWKLIIDSLHSDLDKFHLLNRAQLVDDALNLARAGKLDYEIALDVVDYLHEETDYIPWASAFSGLSFLSRKLVSEEGYDHFQTYIIDMLEKTYGEIGFDIAVGDGHITHLHRSTLLNWACTFDHEDCVQQANEKFNDYYLDPTKLVPANLRNVVYCTALRYGGADEWNYLWNVYLTSRIGAEKVVILSALGCTEDEALLTDYLQKSIDETSGIRRQDAASAFSAVYANPKGVDVAFDFLTQRYEDIAVYYGGMNAIGNILTGIAGRLTTEEQVNRLEQFITENTGNLGAAAESGLIAVESAKADLDWTNTHKEAILTWFKNKVTTEEPTSTDEPQSTTPDSASILGPNVFISLAIAFICSYIKQLVIH